MVKTQLGPDAIILSARDNNKSFGLVGEGSVEITAAVSEETLQKRTSQNPNCVSKIALDSKTAPLVSKKELIHKMVEETCAEESSSCTDHATSLYRYRG